MVGQSLVDAGDGGDPPRVSGEVDGRIPQFPAHRMRGEQPPEMGTVSYLRPENAWASTGIRIPMDVPTPLRAVDSIEIR
jgi:hypothetical protein